MDPRSMLLDDNNYDWFADLTPSADDPAGPHISCGGEKGTGAEPAPTEEAYAPRPIDREPARWSPPTDLDEPRSGIEFAVVRERDRHGVADRAPLRRWAAEHRTSLVIAGTAAVAALAVGVVLIGQPSSPENVAAAVHTNSPATSAPAPRSAPLATADAWCAGSGSGAAITASSTDPGASAIARFEDAYYLDRDASKARDMVAADATTIGTVAQLGAGIAEIPPGTEHCVLASTTGPGVYAVDVFERRPDGSGHHYKQSITTAAAPAPRIGSILTTVAARGDL